MTEPWTIGAFPFDCTCGAVHWYEPHARVGTWPCGRQPTHDDGDCKASLWWKDMSQGVRKRTIEHTVTRVTELLGGNRVSCPPRFWDALDNAFRNDLA